MKRFMLTMAIIVGGLAFSSISMAQKDETRTETVTDIDGNVYQTVVIGNQIWMAENLKVTHYRNGDPILNVTDYEEWKDPTGGAYCNYNNDTSYVETYGRLYNWYAVDDSRGLAPEGWHVATDEEWKQLEMSLGMSQEQADLDEALRGTDEGGKLKEMGTVHWNSPNTGATNESGFSALPSGGRGINDNDGFGQLNIYTAYWTSSDNPTSGAPNRYLQYQTAQIGRYTAAGKYGGHSVRCVRDLPFEASDTLYIPNEYVVTDSEIVVPINYFCSTPTRGGFIPLQWEPTDLNLNRVTFSNTALEDWSALTPIIYNDSNKVGIVFNQGEGSSPILDTWDTTLAFLHFERPIIDLGMFCILEPPAINYDSLTIIINESTINNQELLFADTVQNPTPNDIFPIFESDTIVTPYGYIYDEYLPGDVNNNGAVNIIDITHLINYLYVDGPPPIVLDGGDPNHNGAINILDVTYLIVYLYQGGPGPECGCITIECMLLSKASSEAIGNMIVEYRDGSTFLSTDYDLTGLELELHSADNVSIESSIDGVNPYYRQSGNHIKLGMVDITGENWIKSNQNIMVIDGIAEIVSALGADLNNNGVGFNIVYSNAPAIVPTEFSLGHNYPNPFNPTTTIEFSLPVATKITLSVYDILGRRVETLVDEHLEAGSHSAIFDASSVASGVYFYRIDAGEFTATRKMTLLK